MVPKRRPARTGATSTMRSCRAWSVRRAANSVRSPHVAGCIRFTPVDLPSVPPNSVQLAAGARMADYLGIADKKERVLGLVSLDVRVADRSRDATGRRQARRGRWLPLASLTSRSSRSSPATRSSASRRVRTPRISCSSPPTRSFCTSRPRRCAPRVSAREAWRASTSAPKRGAIFFSRSIRARMWWSPRSRRPPRRWPAPIRDAPRSRASANSPARVAPPAECARTPSSRAKTSLALAWVGRPRRSRSGSDGAAARCPRSERKRDASGTPLDAVVGSIGRGL